MNNRNEPRWTGPADGPWATVAIDGELERADREWLHTNGAGASVSDPEVVEGIKLLAGVAVHIFRGAGCGIHIAKGGYVVSLFFPLSVESVSRKRFALPDSISA